VVIPAVCGPGRGLWAVRDGARNTTRPRRGRRDAWDTSLGLSRVLSSSCLVFSFPLVPFPRPSRASRRPGASASRPGAPGQAHPGVPLGFRCRGPRRRPWVPLGSVRGTTTPFFASAAPWPPADYSGGRLRQQADHCPVREGNRPVVGHRRRSARLPGAGPLGLVGPHPCTEPGVVVPHPGGLPA
jgi:hypothetical protein